MNRVYLLITHVNSYESCVTLLSIDVNGSVRDKEVKKSSGKNCKHSKGIKTCLNNVAVYNIHCH